MREKNKLKLSKKKTEKKIKLKNLTWNERDVNGIFLIIFDHVCVFSFKR